MSTSIQEKDFIQTIKELQQRVTDLERQQRTIASGTINAGQYVRIENFGIEVGERGPTKTYISLLGNGEIVTRYQGVSGLLSDMVFMHNGQGLDLGGDKLDGTPGFHTIQGTLAISNNDWIIPATPTSSGYKGTISWNATHLYVCTATNTWRRVALSTW